MRSLLLLPFHLLYRGLRPLRLVDVTHLMHLPTCESRVNASLPGYEIRTLTSVELESHRIAGTAPKHIGTIDDAKRRAIVVAMTDGKVVSFVWLVRHWVDAKDNFARTAHLGTSIEMPAGTAFIYNAWTHPNHRGQGLVGTLAAYAVRHRVLSVWALLTSIDWTNRASMKAFEKLGMRSLGIVARFGLGPLQFSITPKSATRLGLRVAEKAPGAKIAF
jgi:predicted GNAT family acetyltransferase